MGGQIKKKWIEDNAVDGDKLALLNEQFVRGRNAADTSYLNLLKVNSNDKGEFGVEPVFSGSPSSASSLVNRQYVLDVIAGIRDLKDAVRLATDSLPAFTASGTGVGKTLTGSNNGALSVDGQTVNVGERIGHILNGIDGGIYVVTQVGDSGTPFILTRSEDADENSEVTQGLSFDVIEGTANGRTRWLLTTANPDIDVTSLTFVETPAPSQLIQFKDEEFVLSSTDISNGYVDLANEAETGSVLIWADGGLNFDQDEDYTLSVVGGVTRITFAGSMSANLVDGDKIIVKYSHF